VDDGSRGNQGIRGRDLRLPSHSTRQLGDLAVDRRLVQWLQQRAQPLVVRASDFPSRRRIRSIFARWSLVR
jgi:hypothetical protein